MGGRGSWSGTRDKARRKGVAGTGGKKGKVNPIKISDLPFTTLEGAENYSRHLDKEQLYFFDKDMKVTKAYQGSEYSVSFPMNNLLMNDAVVTHNHPEGSEGYGGTFSIADMLNFASSNWKEHRAVSEGQGEWNYIARKKDGTTWQQQRALYNRIQKDRADLNKRAEAEYNRMYRSLRRKKQSKESAEHGARQAFTGIYAQYWADVLPQYGYEYVARKNPYQYNR